MPRAEEVAESLIHSVGARSARGHHDLRACGSVGSGLAGICAMSAVTSSANFLRTRDVVVLQLLRRKP